MNKNSFMSLCLFRSYHCLSKLQEAVLLYDEAIKKQKEALGEMHCDTLASEIDLGFCYIDLEQPEVRSHKKLYIKVKPKEYSIEL